MSALYAECKCGYCYAIFRNGEAMKQSDVVNELQRLSDRVGELEAIFTDISAMKYRIRELKWMNAGSGKEQT